MYLCMHIMSVFLVPKRSKESIVSPVSPELKLQIVWVTMQVLEAEPGSSIRAVSAINYKAISSSSRAKIITNILWQNLVLLHN